MPSLKPAGPMREVEAAAHGLQCDVVCQFHELAVVGMLAEPVE